MEPIYVIIVVVTGLALGFLAGYFLKIKSLQKKAEQILRDAEAEGEIIKKDKNLQAKDKFIELKEKHEKFVTEKNKQITAKENSLNQREVALKQRKDEMSKRIKDFELEKKAVDTLKAQTDALAETLEKRQIELEKLHKQEVETLERISGMSADEAKEQMRKSLIAEAKTEAMAEANEIIEEAKINANKQAKNVIVKTIQRIGTEVAIENAVTVFHIENDEIKGRIIGREGRNIRALEAATGIEIIVDDTPESIVLSSFDPMRREIARLALHQLVTDGRIHPARIEEVVEKTKNQVEEEVLELGKKTTIDLGIHGMSTELMRLVGKMKYRSSYGQNLLQHSRETAKLCAVMAAEVGLNPAVAKRAGLLHDIGKVSDEDIDVPHAIYGMKLAEKFKEKPEVVNAIGSHHDEVEMTSLYAPIVQVCDAISGARPGARREVAESYIKRIKALEELARSEQGVVKTYAIQAGRELRVIVGSDKVSDQDIERISINIAKRIEEEMTYPGQIKITVIRENRAVSYAK